MKTGISLLAMLAIATVSYTSAVQDQWRVDCIIELIQMGDLGQATSELKQIENYERYLPSIVTKLFPKGVQNVERTLYFFGKLHCLAYANGATALLKEMEKNDHFWSYEMLLFSQSISSPSCTDHLAETATAVNFQVGKILDDWAADIRRGNYSRIYEFDRRGASNFSWRSVLRQMPSLVRKAFAGNASNLPAVTKFLGSLRCPYFRRTVSMSIAEELGELGVTNETKPVMAAYKLESESSHNVGSKNDTHFWDVLGDVKRQIQSNHQNDIWETICIITNLHWNENLFAKFEPREGGNSGAFTGAEWDAAVEWITYIKLLDEELTFEFKSKELSSNQTAFYLCQSLVTSSVFICEGKDPSRRNYQWKVESSYWTDASSSQIIKGFFIQNKAFDDDKAEYMEAAAEKSDEVAGREVQSSKTAGVGCYWKIDCV